MIDDFETPKKHVLTQQMLSRILGTQTKNQPNKSVQTPTAQTSTLCGPGKSSSEDLTSVLSSIEAIKNYDRRLYFIASLQYGFGLRISEVLEISPYDITSTGHVKVKGKKGSNERMIFSDILRSYFVDCKIRKIYPFNGIDRFYVYRSYKKFGLSRRFGSNKNSSVTHLFRHLASLAAKENGVSIETRAQQLGHKSTKSTQYYGTNQTR